MLAIATDIETVADPELMAKYLPPVDCKCGNLKDPLKIEAKIAEAEAKQREMAALNPHVARVVCAAFAMRSERTGQIIADADIIPELRDDHERVLIANFFVRLHECRDAREGRVVTFNGQSFDIPFVYRRALILGIAPDFVIETHKYKVTDGSSNHIDVRRVLAETSPGDGPDDFVAGNLDYYGRLLLDKGKPDDMDGSKVGEMFAAGKFEEIRAYAEYDVRELTLPIYEKVRGFYFV